MKSFQTKITSFCELFQHGVKKGSEINEKLFLEEKKNQKKKKKMYKCTKNIIK